MGRALILFGAGASFGSDAGETPPLGQCLYNALAGFSPETWGRVSLTEAASFLEDFEKGMKAFADARPTQVDVLQRAMAAYFFQFKPSLTSAYVRLAKRIRDQNWNGALATLNYERLLTLSLRQAGLCVQYRPPELYTDLELLLPHGCCNLFGNIRAPQSTPGVPGDNLVAQRRTILKLPRRADGTEIPVNLVTQNGGPIAFGERVMLDGEEIREIDAPDQYAKELRESTVPPVMSRFQPDKQTRAGVSFIVGQRQRFADLVRSAPVVAIVGVKVRPHDQHIWNPLAQTSARLVYCAGESAVPEFEQWKKDYGRMEDQAIPAKWDDRFDEICRAISL